MVGRKGEAAEMLKRFCSNRLAVGALGWLVLVALVTISADLWVPRALGEPVVVDTKTVPERMLLSPSLAHPFGTDRLGRDIAARVIYGTRTSLLVGFVGVAIMVVLGLGVGGAAAYRGGFWDAVLMRTADVMFAFPFLLFAIVLIALLGRGTPAVFIAIGFLGWPSIARVFRSSVLATKENEYVYAARALGESGPRILVRHIMPNALGPTIAFATMAVGAAILAEAGLSFLGMGVSADQPSWGVMLSEAWASTGAAPWLTLFPGIAVASTVLCFMLLGDGLRDALDVREEG
jgi:peptide/nickel transport system permease protein